MKGRGKKKKNHTHTHNTHMGFQLNRDDSNLKKGIAKLGLGKEARIRESACSKIIS